MHDSILHIYVYYYPVPGPPTDLTISPPPGSCDVLVITWTAPFITGGLPVNYKLFLNENYNYSLTVSSNHIDIQYLPANTEYTVTAVAVNELGEGGNVTGTGRTRPEGLIICY